MEIPKNVPKLWEQLDKFQENMGKVLASLTHPKQKAILGDVLQQLAAKRAELETTLPDLVKTLHAENEQRMAKAKEMLAEIEKMKEGYEAKKKALEEAKEAKKAEKPVVPDPAIDPGLGVALGADILARLGRKQGKEGRPDSMDEGSVAEFWLEPTTEEGKSEPAPPDKSGGRPSTPAAKQTFKSTKPPRRREGTSDEDTNIWEDLE